MEMVRRSKLASLFLPTLMAILLSQNMVIPAMSITCEDQKNFYIPDPNAQPTPRSFQNSPPRDSGRSTPSTPSKPPQNCRTPPRDPATPPPGGGGNNYPPPQDPTQTPSSPSGPTTPISLTPPFTPIIDPGTPSAPTITPPFLPYPNSPFIGTCNYWRTHPAAIWNMLGWLGTLGNAFGTTTGFPGFGPNLTLRQALSNTRTDGIGALYREGTASFLNSVLNNRFPFTTNQVRESFIAALGSNKAAAAQAQAFKKANEGRVKPRA